jgi:hypothetical protein
MPGRARARGRGRGRGGRAGRDAGGAGRPRRALLGALVRLVRGVPARPAAALLDGVACDGRGRPPRRDEPPLAGRRACLPLLVHLLVRRGVRSAGAVVRADPPGSALRDCGARRLRRDDRHRRRLAHGRGAAWGARGRARLRRRRPLGCGRRGGGRSRGDRRRRRERGAPRGGGGARRDTRRSLGGDAGGDGRGGRGGLGRRRRLRDRGDWTTGGDGRRLPLDARARRGGY